MNDDLDAMIKRVDPFAYLEASERGPSESLWQTINDRRGVRHKVSVRGRVVAISGVIAVLGISLALVMGAIPGSGPTPSAAATQLREIAGQVGPPAGLPGNGRWLHRTLAFSLHTSPYIGTTLTGNLGTWAGAMNACQAAVFQTPKFGSNAAEAAWRDAGLSASPVASGPQGYCGSSVLPTAHPLNAHPLVLSSGILPIDVSSLTSDPTTLAHELETGTTGIPSLDQGVARDDPQAGFQRAALLLLAPLTGAKAGVLSGVYKALALLPGVSALGTVTTHTGTKGEGFAASTTPSAVEIIVSPRTGDLLEIRNMQFRAWRLLWAQIVLSSFSAFPIGGQNMFVSPLAGQLLFTRSWVDPVGSPTIVDTSAIPPLHSQTSA